jgi:sensor histidine kinase YesM
MVLLFVVVAIFGDVLVFIFEVNKNPQINNLSDSFVALETILHLADENAIYPITVGGRVTVFSTLILIAVLAVIFSSQVMSILSIGKMKKEFQKIKKTVNQTKLEILTQAEETKNRQEKILRQQQNIVEYEEDIIEKLDALRKKKV